MKVTFLHSKGCRGVAFGDWGGGVGERELKRGEEIQERSIYH